MSRAPVKNHIQGPISHFTGDQEYQRLEAKIFDTHKIVCTVKVGPETISIRIESYPDFILAKAAIKTLAGSRVIIQG